MDQSLTWFLTDHDAEIATWIDDNLEDSTYSIGRTIRDKRSVIVHFGSDTDRVLFMIRWT